ncbi:MAG: hypothetical protein P4L91_14425 [Burkholderiaceae bacterium]|nr:hypothetical protein [Burkholderiaceae bacterium]
MLKSLCSVESAELVLLLLDEVLELELDEVSSEIRLFRLLCRLAGPLLPLTLEVDALLSLSPSLSVLEVLLPLPCACNAAIRLCRNAETAWSALLLDDVEEVEEVEDDVDDVPEVDEPELSLELPTPIDDSALEIAPSKPPPLSPDGGGGSEPRELMLSVPLEPLLVLLLLASWLSWDNK